jgi:hypothetical protein
MKVGIRSDQTSITRTSAWNLVMQLGLFLYPWNFAEEGCQQLVEYARGLGVGRLYVASAYHAGFFLHSHSQAGKVRLLEDGVVYFCPDDDAWSASRIRPVVSQLCESGNLFGEIAEAAAVAEMELSAWTVCLHNTRLGLEYADCTVHNVYGDSYPHALTPGHPDARAYVIGLVNDLTKNHALHSVFLEAPNYRGRAHGGTWVSGHHHERNGVYLRDLEESLLSISFNPADIRGAEASGIAVGAVRDAVRAHLDRYFAAAPEIPDDLPGNLGDFRQQVPALADYEAYFRHTEESLLAELRQLAEPRGVKLIGASSPSIDIVFIGLYGEPVERIAELVQKARQQMAPWQELVVAIRLGFQKPGDETSIDSAEELQTVVQAVRRSGADSIAFYNYAEAPRRSVEWIRSALEDARE